MLHLVKADKSHYLFSKTFSSFFFIFSVCLLFYRWIKKHFKLYFVHERCYVKFIFPSYQNLFLNKSKCAVAIKPNLSKSCSTVSWEHIRFVKHQIISLAKVQMIIWQTADCVVTKWFQHINKLRVFFLASVLVFMYAFWVCACVYIYIKKEKAGWEGECV